MAATDPTAPEHCRSSMRSLRPLLIISAAVVAIPAGIVLLIAMLGMWSRASSFALGEEDANEAWSAGQAQVIDHDGAKILTVGSARIFYDCDLKTGLPFKVSYGREDPAYEAGYDARVRALLVEHGLPRWSLVGKLPTPEVLAGLLDSDEMTQITAFPCRIPFQMDLDLRADADDDVVLVTKQFGLVATIVLDGAPVFWTTVSDYPNVAFLRIGRSRLYAYHNDGRIVCCAFQEASPDLPTDPD
jgi:hypothetical protein